MFASRAVFVVVLSCRCTLRARLEKEHRRMAAPVERENLTTPDRWYDGESLVKSCYNM